MNKFSNEQILVDQLKSNSRAAFEYLYDQYAGALLFVIGKAVNEEQATEVLEDVFLKIWSTIHTYDPAKRSLFGWMLHVMREVAAQRGHLPEKKLNSLLPRVKVA